ncbi:hypothetical protein K2Z83_13195 [Oscillochloris sp. ZM17-4]|uniref:hypothetical protein n=1 Tax=Oscillochloris sp. ZM17-4 TaxID=2866714 RepID=UPI001C732865|nr:hypothetical protein [Oscillochloris sp. ZM17-4]MBX0328633.1 hypothetical protein [Oscillochloris sp. ZM17-4]
MAGLPIIHAVVGALVVLSNAAAAGLLWPRPGGPAGPWAGRALLAARAALAAQVLLGVALAAGGYAGRQWHYLGALGAVAAAWWAAGRGRSQRDQALGCALAAGLALAAYLLARG